MDAYLAAAAKCNALNAEGIQRVKPKENAQIKNEICQTTAHLNKMSFIPVYSKKSACHKFSRSENDCENPFDNPSPDKVLTTYSPPARHRSIIGKADALSPRMVKTRMRRRSVGFEDMTTLSSYDHNFANDIRFQEPMCNSNASYSAAASHNNFMNPNSSANIGKSRLSEDNSFSFNHNASLNFVENENIVHRKNEKISSPFKDKSSKRKSSLNRMDFIHFPSSTSSLGGHMHDGSQQNSSSDESTDKSRSKKNESPCSYSKRKYTCSLTHLSKDVKEAEISAKNSSLNCRSRCNLPKSSHSNTLSPRPSRWKHIAASKFCQKLSHSAGELESLTDCSEISKNKTYLSAQEYASECCNHNHTGSISKNKKTTSKTSTDKTRKNGKGCDYSSQANSKKELELSGDDSASSDKALATELSSKLESCDSHQCSKIAKDLDKMEVTESEVTCKDADCLVEENTAKLDKLELRENISDSVEIYVSADESGEAMNSDGERRPSSILRKKSFEERKELHSILKPPPDDKISKTPPSILKHRESSEEKDSCDLHSILKKSGSEDESCNSGPDIRPILKQSTDEESPGGTLRPRPILKKRTSFSDDCSYTNVSSVELKPILKKKTALSISLEEQPKPILKSRRKSEDTRSTTEEVVASRPRAYSADMGVKASKENQLDSLETKDDFHKLDNDL